MNEAVKLTPITTHPKFKDGDGGGESGKVLEIKVDVVDNGYILSAMLDIILDVDHQGMPIPTTLEEVYLDSASLLKRMAELVKA